MESGEFRFAELCSVWDHGKIGRKERETEWKDPMHGKPITRQK